MTEVAPSETRASVAGFDVGAAGITPPSDPDRRGVFLVDIIVGLGYGDDATVREAERKALEAKMTFEHYLLESGTLDGDQLSFAIAERNGLDHVDLDRFEVDKGAAELISRSAAQRYNAVPIAFASDGALIVAVEDPLDGLGLSDVEVMTRSEVRPAIASGSKIRALIERLPDEPRPQWPAPPEPLSPVAPPALQPEREVAAPEDQEPVALDARRPESPPEPGPSIGPEPESVLPIGLEPEPGAPIEPEPEPGAPIEPELEPTPSIESGPEPGLEIGPEPEVVEQEPVPAVTFEPKLVPEARPPAQGRLSDLAEELRELREAARRADTLALNVERRIGELEGETERAERLEAQLTEAQNRIVELKRRLSGVDTATKELRATTEKLEDLYRALEDGMS
jgi:MshEN domain